MNDGGQIAYINSGFWVTDPDPAIAGTDIFVTVPMFKLRVEQMIRDQEGTEWNMDRWGNDLGPEIIASDYFQCLTECAKLNNCSAITYDIATQQCWRKGALNSLSYASMNTVGSPASPVEVYADRPGIDLIQHENVSDFQICNALCGRNPDCWAWTLQQSTRRCFLKSAIPALNLTNACATSGDCVSGSRRDREVGFDRSKGAVQPFRTLPNASQQACRTACATDAGCRAFTWLQNSNSCQLMPLPGVPQPASAADGGLTVSSVKGGIQTHTERSGGTNIRSFTPTPALPEACQAACAADSRCVAWSMITPPAGSNNVCTLKSTAGTRASRAGAYSGLKGLEHFNAR